MDDLECDQKVLHFLQRPSFQQRTKHLASLEQRSLALEVQMEAILELTLQFRTCHCPEISQERHLACHHQSHFAQSKDPHQERGTKFQHSRVLLPPHLPTMSLTSRSKDSPPWFHEGLDQLAQTKNEAIPGRSPLARKIVTHK